MNRQAPMPYAWPDVQGVETEKAQPSCPEQEVGYLLPQLLGLPEGRCLSRAQSGSLRPRRAMPLSFS